jgi:dTDP-4-amino-4,6-dideoxygalactose transaminase
LAAGHDVAVVEDAAQAQGARYRFPDGREAMCGTMGVAGAFSFYPGKNLGAIGEAGAVVTRDTAGAVWARRYRDHGQSKKYVHEIATGGNFRLDALQASVLSIKLRHLDRWNDARRRAAALYDELLGGCLTTPVAQRYARHVYHLYVVQTPERDRLREELARDGIGTGLHYPIPLHLQPAFAGSESVEDVALPETEWLAATCLSLPMHPHLTDDQVGAVAAAVLKKVESAVVV